jgi:hypothetical protein
MLTRAENDFLAAEATPYPAKTPIPLDFCEQPPLLTSTALRKLEATNTEFLVPRHVDKRQVMQRNPVTNPAKCHALRHWKSLGQSLCAFTPDISHLNRHRSSTDNLLTSMRNLAKLQRNRDFGKMVEWALSFSQGFALPQLLGFIAAVAVESDPAEFDFSRGAEASRCSADDLPHLHHLTDEFHLVSLQPDAGFPLLELNFLEPDIKPIQAAFSRRGHLIPNLRSAPPPSIDVPADCKRMLKDAEAAARSMPLPLPLSEGNQIQSADAPRAPLFVCAKGKVRGAIKARGRTAKGKDVGDVIWLIQERKWEAALAVVTDAILKNPEDPELYLHRAYCEMHFEKYADGVLDCTRSLEIKSSEKAFRMRAACWLKLGETDLSALDMDEVADLGLPSAVPRKVRPLEPPDLRSLPSPQAKSWRQAAK